MTKFRRLVGVVPVAAVVVEMVVAAVVERAKVLLMANDLWLYGRVLTHCLLAFKA